MLVEMLAEIHHNLKMNLKKKKKKMMMMMTPMMTT